MVPYVKGDMKTRFKNLAYQNKRGAPPRIKLVDSEGNIVEDYNAEVGLCFPTHVLALRYGLSLACVRQAEQPTPPTPSISVTRHARVLTLTPVAPQPCSEPHRNALRRLGTPTLSPSFWNYGCSARVMMLMYSISIISTNGSTPENVKQ